MDFWYHLAKFAYNELFVERPKRKKEKQEFQEQFDSNILKYINEINKDAEKDAKHVICRNLSNSLYEFSKYVIENYKSKSKNARSIKEGTFKWRADSILNELKTAWRENKKILQEKSDLTEEQETKAARSYISKKRAYNALKFLTMKGNKRSYWNKDFCKKIKIPEEFISKYENNKK